MKTKSAFLISLTFLVIFFGSACQASRTTKGGAIGAGAGGIIGGVIGERSGNTAAGILIGATVGGATGAIIGRYMDKQAAEIQRDLEGAKVERVGEGILITFDSGLLFDVGKFSLRPATKANLNELSATLSKYEDTEILVQGHTDSTGSDELNMELSENRAKAVRNHLTGQGVAAPRFTVQGFGESLPLADNDTASGRQQNRRVEIAIYANKKLQKAARRGDLE
ncbi:MAG: OmpA family protein [Lewinella sp.]|jgi:outer membrane protein OmpA-like peptidoglycan-associated protein|uniref:OmpA family protein n=1 Tax=Lewinella sp. TaxID=2004506 RepID=UPI003D6A4D24